MSCLQSLLIDVKERLVIYSKVMATPILAFLSISLRSTLTTLPLLIRAYCPFSCANVVVRGKFISTILPGRTGVVIGTVTKTPVLLTFELRPLKNLLASGIQRLTGHESFVLGFLRCSTNVSIKNPFIPGPSITKLLYTIIMLSVMLIWID